MVARERTIRTEQRKKCWSKFCANEHSHENIRVFDRTTYFSDSRRQSTNTYKHMLSPIECHPEDSPHTCSCII